MELMPTFSTQSLPERHPTTPTFEVEVLLPVHNEASSIEATIRGMHAEFSALASAGFIVCEDGSKDDSKQVLRKLAEEIPLRLNLSEARKGYSLAMREGMAMTDSDYLLCLDSDGQCDPRDFAVFWEARGTADVLIGWRVHRADTLLRRTFSGIFHVMYQTVFHVPIHDPSCPYVLFRREVAHRMARELGQMKEGFWWEFVARVHRHGFTMREFAIHHRVRSAGVTQVYKWNKMPGIFLRHVSALWIIWRETRPAA
jgi:dolichol-phosphate mannosyltransferase